jgi:hypothetical protein
LGIQFLYFGLQARSNFIKDCGGCDWLVPTQMVSWWAHDDCKSLARLVVMARIFLVGNFFHCYVGAGS